MNLYVFLKVARLSSFVGAMAIGDLVKSTLGPKGMDKILWGMGRNDGIVEVSIFLIFYIMTTLEEQQFKPF